MIDGVGKVDTRCSLRGNILHHQTAAAKLIVNVCPRSLARSLTTPFSDPF
jgi:hypothetical protein